MIRTQYYKISLKHYVYTKKLNKIKAGNSDEIIFYFFKKPSAIELFPKRSLTFSNAGLKGIITILLGRPHTWD